MATKIADIAKATNLSSTAISLILNNRTGHYISEATRERVLKAARDMNYRPNRMAAALVTGKSNIISLWTPPVSLPFYATAVDCFAREISLQGLDLIINQFPGNGSLGWEKLYSFPSDGLIVMDGPGWLASPLENAGKENIPLVTVGAHTLEDADSIRFDTAAGASKAVRHLLAQGCRRIAFVMLEDDFQARGGRFRAYTDGVLKAGLEPVYIPVRSGGRAAAYEAVSSRLAAPAPPDGIFCYDDSMALGSHCAILDRGLRMPSDIALVGFDGIIDTEFIRPRLSTVEVPLEQLCTRAVEFLLRRIKSPAAVHRHLQLKPSLVIRESSRRR